MANLHPGLLALLACPVAECHGSLTLTEAALVCGRCGRSYRIEQSWPVLIPDEATPPAGAADTKTAPRPTRDRGIASPGGAA